MEMAKRFTALLLAVLMLLSLCACGAPTEKAQAETPAETSEETQVGVQA